MPSVAQGPLTNGVDFVHKDKVGEPLISGFTAVNGRGSPPQAHKTNGVNGTNGMTSDTIHVRPLSQQGLDETQDQKIPVSQKDDWQFASSNGNGARVVTPPSSYSRESVESSENRKRSSPDDEEENSYHPHDTTANQSRRRVDTYESAPRDDSPNTIPHGLPMSIENTPQHGYQGVNGERSDRNWPTRDSVGAMNDSQFAEALQRESRSMESPSGGADGSPEDSSMTAGGDMQNAAEHSSTTEITRAGVQVDPKKRKRQFANRTKTGCQTCRRRKKKCDEAKPECSNCLRGGFICEGYANKATWTKPSISKGHVPLQAKDSFSEQSTLYHRHGHAREGYVNPNPPPPPPPPPPQQIDGARARPIVVEEHDRQPARNPWGNPWPENHHRPYAQEHTQAPEYSHPPPMTAHPRPQHPGHPGEYEQHPGPAPIAQRPPAPQAYNHTQNVQNINSSQSALTAQLALQRQAQTTVHPPQAPPPPQAAPPAQPPSQKSEKEKMLSGEWYKLFGPQLVDEREQCKAYLFRFNNSTNPNVGVSREERARLFRAVLEAPWARNANSPNSPNGSLGRDVCVEAPFTCDYGYNINIGDEVVIGSNCTILDPCRIVIGARTIIGPNVNIFGNTVSTDPRARKGSQGTAIGSPITIEEDVYIGGNVTILPGVRIGKGSTVGAGSVVTHDVPRFTVALGNPARVKRGIWLNENN